MPATAAIISGGLGLAKSIYGAIDSGKAKKELANLKPFDWKIQDEYFQNRNMAGNMATQGLDSASKDFYTTEAQRGLGSTFEAISQGGGNDPNVTSGLMDNYNRGLANLAATDASKRLDNIKYFIGENAKLAGKLDIKQGLKFQDYQRNLKQLMERRATGQANLWGGIGDVVSSVGAYGTAKQNEELLDIYKANIKRGNAQNETPMLQPLISTMPKPQILNNSQEQMPAAPSQYNEQQLGWFNIPSKEAVPLQKQQLLTNPFGINKWIN